jgi:hypothetical protein
MEQTSEGVSDESFAAAFADAVKKLPPVPDGTTADQRYKVAVTEMGTRYGGFLGLNGEFYVRVKRTVD